MAAFQYDPKNISVIVGGTQIVGFTDGTFVLVERNEDMWNMKVGVDGIGTRAKTNNKSGKYTITLHQSSPSNDYLTGLTLTDENTNAGAVPILIRDNLGTTNCTSLTAWVKKFANVEDGKEVSNRVWVLESDDIEMFVGGNQVA
jgi:Bacteriophage KPP10, Structural protein ORF10